MNSRLLLLMAAIAAFCCGQLSADNSLDARKFNAAMELYRSGNIEPALNDFRALADKPESAYADDAMFAMGKHHYPAARVGEFTPAKDSEAARTLFEKIVGIYAESNQAPAALTQLGMMNLDPAVGKPNYEDAYANFHRVLRLYPDSSVLDAATYGLGLSLAYQGQVEKALTYYTLLFVNHPDSLYVSMGYYQAAKLMAQAGNRKEALAHLARLVTLFPNDPFTDKARALSTLIYRFEYPYKYKFKKAFPLATTDGTVRRVNDMFLAPDGTLLVSAPSNKSVYRFHTDGRYAGGFAADKPSTVWQDSGGHVYTANDANLLIGTRKHSLYIDTKKVLAYLSRISAGLVLPTGEIVAYDRGQRDLILFESGGKTGSKAKYILAESVDVSSLLLDPLNRIWMLDQRGKQIAALSSDGNILIRIPFKGEDHEMPSPEKMAFDTLGNLYVLDDREKAVYMFSVIGNEIKYRRRNKPKSDEGVLKRPTALAIMEDGSILVFDETGGQIKQYD